MRKVANKIQNLENQYQVETLTPNLNFGLVNVVYKWASNTVRIIKIVFKMRHKLTTNVNDIKISLCGRSTYKFSIYHICLLRFHIWKIFISHGLVFVLDVCIL